MNSFHPYWTRATAHRAMGCWFVIVSLSCYFFGGWTLLRNGAFAQVLSKCMTVSRHKCVGGHVKNEWHFEWMHSVVHKFVSTQGNVLKCCSNLALQMFSFGIQQTLILTDSELPKHIRVIMHIAVGYTVLSSQMRHIFPCFFFYAGGNISDADKLKDRRSLLLSSTKGRSLFPSILPAFHHLLAPQYRNLDFFDYVSLTLHSQFCFD